MRLVRRSAARACGLLLLGGALVRTARAADWPQWRGPGRDGVGLQLRAPKSWPEKLARAWSVPVGEGHGSPVLVGDRVFLHTREGEQEVARSVQLADGRTLWRVSWPVTYEMNSAAASHGKGPKATPTLIGGTLYIFSITGLLSAFDPESGALRWRRDFSTEFKKTSPLFGAASSPLADRDLVILHTGGHHNGSLTAFDARTGDVRWSLKGDGPGYASPIVTELGGRRQVITQTDQRIIGVAADTGRLIWSLPFTTPYDQNSVTALVSENLLITSGIEQGVHAWKLEPEGEQLVPREAWNLQEASFYLSSPVIASGLMFGFSHMKRGQFVCVDPKTGQLLWASKGREGENAALVVAGDLVLALTDSAELIVLPAGAKQFAPAARYTVADSPTWAHPVVTPRGILIKDKTHLSLWSWPS